MIAKTVRLLILCMVLLIPSTGFSSDLFAPRLDYGTSEVYPVAVTSGDFNSDGKSDIATANFYGINVSVMLGNGNGTFQSKTDSPTGYYPYSITTGDFNGDGKTDLVTSHIWAVPGPYSINVLLGNGDGTFQAPIPLYSGYWSFCVKTGDFNGDGKTDLAVTNGSEAAVSIFIGNGDGTFQPRADYTLYPASVWPTSLTIGDFNGDEKLDIATLNTWWGNISTVSILLGNGDGTFQTPTHFPAGNVQLPASQEAPTAITAADFNNDGKLDLVAANTYENNISVLIGDGDGTFQAKTDYGTGWYPSSVSVDDFDADGKLDIAVANSWDNTVSILLGYGNGTFQPKLDFETGGYPFSVITKDFNGDGRIDIATANMSGNSVSVLLNIYGTSPASPTGSISINNNASATCSADVTLALSATDPNGEVIQMRFSSDNSSWSNWETYSTSQHLVVPEGYGIKTVCGQFKSWTGRISDSVCDTIYLNPTTPVEVISVVNEMVALGEISDKGIGSSLISSLNIAQSIINKQPAAVKNILTAEIYKLKALSGKKMSHEAANRLIEYLNCIIARL